MSDVLSGLEARGVSFAPPPAHFPMTAIDTGGRDALKAGRGGLCTWISRTLMDLTGPEHVVSHHSLCEVTGSDGLQAAAQVAVTYDPAYERVVIHAVRVHRGGEVRDVAEPRAFELIQRELNMERAVYDGRRTAHMVIPDIRVGDRVETCFSVIGQNPALKGLFSWRFVLQWDVPMMETRCALRVPVSRPIATRGYGRAPDPVEAVEGDVRTLTWTTIDAPTYQVQAYAPASFTGYAAVRVADQKRWSQIADVFRDAYEPGRLPDELAGQAAQIRDASADPGLRLIHALHLVQGVLRYHSVSLGEGGFRPRGIDQIWATRYGDCKDGSLLLTAILRALGIDAVCALVNSYAGDALGDALPSVGAFNHCVVRARINGRVYWLDSTWGFQGGDLDHLTQPDFHWALPLEADAALERIAAPPAVTESEITEIWTLPSRNDLPAEIEITSCYRSRRADMQRRWLGNEGGERVADRLREDMEQVLQSRLDTIAPPDFHDDQLRNELVMAERYYVLQPFAANEDKTLEKTPHVTFVSRDDITGAHLPQIGPETRREPIDLGHPRRIVATRIIRFPVDMDRGGAWDERIEGPCGLSLRSAFEWRARREGVHTLDLSIAQTAIPTNQAEPYREFLKQAVTSNAVVFRIMTDGRALVSGRGKPAKGTGVSGLWLTVAMILIVGAITRFVAILTDGAAG